MMLSSLSLLALSTARCPSIVNGTSFGKSETASSIEKKQCSSASLCCARCSAETACAAWSFYVGPNETQLCNLLHGVGWSTQTDVPGASSGVSTPPSPPSPPGGEKNLLYLMVDDLRTLTPAARLWTPNLNKLAASGVTFSHAYCQHAVCAPSRNSFMSGLRPETTQVWTFAGNFRDCSDDVAGKTWIPHPEHYKRSGFLTLGGGKTYHPKHPPNYDEPFSWSPERPYFPFSEKGCPFFQTSAENAYTHSLCVLDIDREDTFDHRLANDTIHSLRFAAAANANASAAAEGAPAAAAKPFAIFAGFRRPHVPWRLPRYWWDRFANLTVSPPKNSSVYADAPQIAFTCGDRCDWLLWDPDAANTSAGQGRANVPNTSYSRTVALPDAYASTIRRGYVELIPHPNGGGRRSPPRDSPIGSHTRARARALSPTHLSTTRPSAGTSPRWRSWTTPSGKSWTSSIDWACATPLSSSSTLTTGGAWAKQTCGTNSPTTKPPCAFR